VGKNNDRKDRQEKGKERVEKPTPQPWGEGHTYEREGVGPGAILVRNKRRENVIEVHHESKRTTPHQSHQKVKGRAPKKKGKIPNQEEGRISDPAHKLGDWETCT